MDTALLQDDFMGLKNLCNRTLSNLNNTTKSDKYIRLWANGIKFIRTIGQQNKQKYQKLYKNLLILRQVLRWHGIYQNVLEIKNKKNTIFEFENINNLAYILFEMFSDFLDRMIFVIDIFGLKFSQFYNRIDQMESDCYFIQCAVLTQYHIRTLKKTLKQGTPSQKQQKILKIIKYIIDSLTSYCKFSKRIFQLQPKYAAILGILSSIFGLIDLYY